MGMTPEQKYEFDTQGYLVLKKVLSKPFIEKSNKIIENLENINEENYPENVIHGKTRTKSELYISNIIESDKFFFELINNKNYVDIIKSIHIGNFRLNHTYSISRWDKGYTYLHMAAKPLHPKATYQCNGDEIFSLTNKVVIPLLGCKKKDGGFGVIPGSHKSNFERPYSDHPDENPSFSYVDVEIGDVIIFTEALTHGSFVNTTGNQRRTIYLCYSVGYMPDWGKLGLKFSKKFFDSLTNEQKKIVELKPQ
tara:strand:- start:3402 stop:4157 length:756 start_codon:yes stop_codon:yes gene_type:complete